MNRAFQKIINVGVRKTKPLQGMWCLENIQCQGGDSKSALYNT